MTPAAQARQKAGLEVADAARQAGCCENYLRRIERSGDCSYPMAQRLSRLYRCSINVFVMKQGRQTPEQKKQSAVRQVGK